MYGEIYRKIPAHVKNLNREFDFDVTEILHSNTLKTKSKFAETLYIKINRNNIENFKY